MSPATSAQRNRKIVLMVTLGAAVLILLVLASLIPTTRQQPVTGTIDRRGESVAPVPLPNFPPLRIRSSGRLPQDLQGLRLGMTIAEAVEVEPDLKTFYPSKKIDSAAAKAFLVARTARGFSNPLQFDRGRLFYIEFELANTSQEDTSALRNDTVAQLGPPTLQVWDFPETTQLIWIDGDVRFAYQDWAFSFSGNGRHPELTVVDWSVYTQAILSALDDFTRHYELVNWGEERVQFRPLPRELQGLQLRTLPWQMRSVLGSDGLERSPCGINCEGWRKTLPSNVSLDVVLWHNQVYEISEDYAIKSSEIRTTEDQLVGEYGTPVQVSSLAPEGPTSFTWTDGEVKLDCIVNPHDENNPQSPPSRSCLLTDLQLYRARNEELLNKYEPKYESVVFPKSFF